MDLIWTNEAENDLTNIVANVEEQFGRFVAVKVYNRLLEHINLLGCLPYMGVKVKDLSSSEIEVRYLINTPNLIFYSIDQTSVNIISIFDYRMSPDGIKQNLQKRLIRKG